MKSKPSVEHEASLSVEHIGGIDETHVAFRPGVNILEGRNATNRTSLLRSIMAALGSNQVALKGDADEGRVDLTIDGNTYTRTIARHGGKTKLGGDPYLDDSTTADLFAFLLETNEARQTVARGDDLRDVIMRPVDTANIQRKIATAEERKDEIDDELSHLRSQEKRLPGLQSERSTIADELAEKRAELDSVREDIESLDSGLDELEAQREEFKDHLSDLNEARDELEEIRRKLESMQDQRNALKSEQKDLREERADLPTSVEEISELGQRLGELQERKRALGSLLDRLQNIIQFNEEIIEDTDSELREALVPDDTDLTDQLLADQEIICWTCGSTVDRDEIEKTLDDLRELRQDKMAQRKEISDELSDLRDRKREMEKHQQRREQIEQRLERIDDRIDQQSQRVEELRDRRASMRDRIAELEREVENIEPEGNDDRILELNKRENELAISIDDLESDLEAVDTQIDEIENEIEKIPQLEDEREAVSKRLTDLRNRIDDLEAEAVTAFNDHMENLIKRLSYENLDRIWIERRETTSREGRQRVTKTKFDLHVVRTTNSGAAYEDTIDHLSESEREVTGLVFALAGYLVHNVYEEVPFMLLDSLEAIDAARIATLVDYFEEYTDFLVVALLPEDAQAVDETYHQITDI